MLKVKKQLVEICHRIHEKGFVSATDGNVSIKIDNEKILCTPTSIPKEKIKISDLVLISLDGDIISGNRKPSTEIKMHLAIYKNRPDVNAVLHAHPVYATALASSRLALDIPFLPEVILSIGKVPVCKYATPSTEEVVNSILPFVKETNLLLLQNHGAVTYGKNLEETFYLMEKLEHTAKILSVALRFNGIRPLSKNQIEKLYNINETTYKISQEHKLTFKKKEK